MRVSFTDWRFLLSILWDSIEAVTILRDSFKILRECSSLGRSVKDFLRVFFKFGDFLSILWDYVKVVAILRDLFEKYISNLGISAADFFEGEVSRGWRVFFPIVWDPAGFYQYSDDPAGFMRIFSS